MLNNCVPQFWSIWSCWRRRSYVDSSAIPDILKSAINYVVVAFICVNQLHGELVASHPALLAHQVLANACWCFVVLLCPWSLVEGSSILWSSPFFSSNFYHRFCLHGHTSTHLLCCLFFSTDSWVAITFFGVSITPWISWNLFYLSQTQIPLLVIESTYPNRSEHVWKGQYAREPW